MKKVLAVVLAGLLLATFAYAGDDIVPAAKTGSKSLNFTFGGFGNFNLGPSGPNGGIGLSYFLSSEAAVRLGLQIKSVSSTIPANPGAGQSGTDGSSSSFGLGLGVDYLMYMNAGRVRPYWGAGLSFAMNSNDAKNAVISPAVQGEDKNNPANGPTGITFGLAGIMGAELFIYNELSLSGEYQLNLININSPSDRVQSSGNQSLTTKQAGTTTILGFSAALASIHIYF